MLTELHLSGIGPAPRFDLDLGRRLNVLTGDNGLGKSFVLDVAWWALTGTWGEKRALPRADRKVKPRISWELELKSGKRSRAQVDFNFRGQSWPWRTGRPPLPGLTVYVRVDGSFSIWDPARNYWRDDPARVEAYHFKPEQVWEGLELEGKTVCNGLIRDWVSWQRQHRIDEDPTAPFARFCKALQRLSPHPGQEWLEPGPPTRLSLEDAREHPTLKFPYGLVPADHASAGIRRILGLAYLVIWAWNEHLQASRLLRQPPETRFILLMDEVETHLHPQWQRRIVPALLDVFRELEREVQVQALVTTHSPLVLASIEPDFKKELDRLFLFELDDGRVRLTSRDNAQYGDALNWLTSEVFGLTQARSLEAERAIEAAEAYMRKDRAALPEGLKTWEQIDAELERLLPGQDPFWPRWVARSRNRR
ncbi:MAG TPA: AAA family ATPase [Myxococcaceae bacterium]|nr:AAA family ATPase [Myxococcaceae bacterium]